MKKWIIFKYPFPPDFLDISNPSDDLVRERLDLGRMRSRAGRCGWFSALPLHPSGSDRHWTPAGL